MTGHSFVDFHLPAGTTMEGPWAVEVTPQRAGWEYTGLRILTLGPGGSHTFGTGGTEVLILPLEGAIAVDCGQNRFALHGRAGVFDGVTDFCYVPRDTQVTVTSAGGGRFALPSADARRHLPARYGAAADIAVEVRGAGPCRRLVHHIATAESFACDRLLVVEVITPGGNWSSYPPHKHDEDGTDECRLEEIYYFEVARAGMGYQRVYASSAERPIDVLAEVRTGDIVVVPHGWHGPSMAAPGYDLYYLNAMAGPGPERAWRVRDDPAHAWVRDTWKDRPSDVEAGP